MYRPEANVNIKEKHGKKREFSVCPDLIGNHILNPLAEWKQQTDQLMQDRSEQPVVKRFKSRRIPEFFPPQAPSQTITLSYAAPPSIPTQPLPPPVQLPAHYQPRADSKRSSQPQPPPQPQQPPLQLPVSIPTTVAQLKTSDMTRYVSLVDWFDAFELKRSDQVVGNPHVYNQFRAYVREIVDQTFTRPRIILLSGPTGCGKSTAAKLILQEAGLDVYEFDPFLLQSKDKSEMELKAHLFKTAVELQWSDKAVNLDVWKSSSKSTESTETTAKVKRRVIFIDHLDSKDAAPLVPVIHQLIMGTAKSSSFQDEKPDKQTSKGNKSKQKPQEKAISDMVVTRKKADKGKKWIPCVIVAICNELKSTTLKKFHTLHGQFLTEAKKRLKKQREWQDKNQKYAEEDKQNEKLPSAKALATRNKIKQELDDELLQDELETRTPRLLHLRVWPIHERDMKSFVDKVVKESRMQNFLGSKDQTRAFWDKVPQMISSAGGDVCALLSSLKSCAYGFSTMLNQMDDFHDPFQLASKFLQYPKPLPKTQDQKDKIQAGLLNDPRALDLLDACCKDHQVKRMIQLILFQNLAIFWPKLHDKARTALQAEITNMLKFKMTSNWPEFRQLSPEDQILQLTQKTSHLLLSKQPPRSQNSTSFIAYQNYQQALGRIQDVAKKKTFETYMDAYEKRRPAIQLWLQQQSDDMERMSEICDDFSEWNMTEAAIYEQVGGEDSEEGFKILYEQSYHLLAHALLRSKFSLDHARDKLLGGGNLKLDVKEHTHQERKVKDSQQWWQGISEQGSAYWSEFDSDYVQPWHSKAPGAKLALKDEEMVKRAAENPDPEPYDIKQRRLFLTASEFKDRLSYDCFDRTKMAADTKQFKKLQQEEIKTAKTRKTRNKQPKVGSKAQESKKRKLTQNKALKPRATKKQKTGNIQSVMQNSQSN